MGQYDFLGRGMAFPVSCDPASGRIREVTEEEDICQSIPVLLSTKKGERVMRPDFGCDICRYAFGIMDSTSFNLMEHAVMDALVRWEPRIREIVVHAKPAPDDGVVHIEIDYRVRSTNNHYNLVYPFYLNEGTGGV